MPVLGVGAADSELTDVVDLVGIDGEGERRGAMRLQTLAVKCTSLVIGAALPCGL